MFCCCKTAADTSDDDEIKAVRRILFIYSTKNLSILVLMNVIMLIVKAMIIVVSDSISNKNIGLIVRTVIV